MECGKNQQEIVISMRESIVKIRSKAMGYLPGQVETSIKDTIDKTLDMDLDKCTGVMEATIKVTGLMESRTERVYMG